RLPIMAVSIKKIASARRR
ncbi:hypothetical protein, partial [Cronobacter sakazakii]